MRLASANSGMCSGGRRGRCLDGSRGYDGLTDTCGARSRCPLVASVAVGSAGATRVCVAADPRWRVPPVESRSLVDRTDRSGSFAISRTDAAKYVLEHQLSVVAQRSIHAGAPSERVQLVWTTRFLRPLAVRVATGCHSNSSPGTLASASAASATAPRQGRAP